MNRKNMLLPAVCFDLYDLYMENGQAAPKQSNIIISKILIWPLNWSLKARFETTLVAEERLLPAAAPVRDMSCK